MAPDHPNDPVRCVTLRPRLEDLAAERLGPVATDELLAHLSECQECAEQFAAILTTRIEAGDDPLLSAPTDLPTELYERYLATRKPTGDDRS